MQEKRKYIKYNGKVYKAKNVVDKPIELADLENKLRKLKDIRKREHDKVDFRFDEREKILKKDIKELKELRESIKNQ